MIQVDYMVLADAVAAVGGKHFIHGGGWDTIFAGSFPVGHPTMAVAIRLRIPWTSTNQPTELELDVLDADGQSILPAPLRGNINLGRPAHLTAGDDQVLPLALPLNGLRFDRPGLYVVVLRLNGEEVARSPFRVSPIPPSGLPQ